MAWTSLYSKYQTAYLNRLGDKEIDAQTTPLFIAGTGSSLPFPLSPTKARFGAWVEKAVEQQHHDPAEELNRQKQRLREEQEKQMAIMYGAAFENDLVLRALVEKRLKIKKTDSFTPLSTLPLPFANHKNFTNQLSDLNPKSSLEENLMELKIKEKALLVEQWKTYWQSMKTTENDKTRQNAKEKLLALYKEAVFDVEILKRVYGVKNDA